MVGEPKLFYQNEGSKKLTSISFLEPPVEPEVSVIQQKGEKISHPLEYILSHSIKNNLYALITNYIFVNKSASIYKLLPN